MTIFRHFILLFFFTLTSCIQSSTETRTPVRYTVLVRNGITGAALEGASVELTDEHLSAHVLTTNENGRVVFPSLESYVNQVIVSAQGFVPTDTVDGITVTDSTASVILRTLNLAIYPEGSTDSDTGTLYNYVVTVLRAPDSQPISGATVSVVSGGSPAHSTVTDSRGMAYLDSLPSKQNLFSISSSGYISVDTLDTAPIISSDESIVLRALRITLSAAPVSP